MKAVTLLSFCTAAFVASVAASSAQFSSSHVADLGSDFDEKVGDGKLYFVKFYAPWCGHCKKLAPAWSELGKSFDNDSAVVIAHVDCTKAKTVCSNAKIGGYPTLKLFYDGEEQEAYRGGRDLPAMKDFLSKQKLTLLQETEE